MASSWFEFREHFCTGCNRCRPESSPSLPIEMEVPKLRTENTRQNEASVGQARMLSTSVRSTNLAIWGKIAGQLDLLDAF
jgi:hypothetical protein